MADSLRFKRIYYYTFFGLTSCAAIAGFVFLLKNYEYIDKLQGHSYYGIFLVSFLATAPVPIFVPSSILIFMLGALLNPLLIGIMGGLGSTTGNFFTYYTGHAGIRLLTSFINVVTPENLSTGILSRITNRVKTSRWYRLAQKHRFLALFIVACLPTPLLTPMVLSMGASRTTMWKVMLVSLAGQTILAIVLAYLGHLGLRAILNVLGVFS
ncbi:MAG: VTT domain-containing protein [Dehalococcoidales bacterium]|nr:VTT domain-containing protein [Dehalococcoidales bacterium]